MIISNTSSIVFPYVPMHSKWAPYSRHCGEYRVKIRVVIYAIHAYIQGVEKVDFSFRISIFKGVWH
jgi:hypothetical protein